MSSNNIISYPLAKGMFPTGGKVFFVSDVTGALWNNWNLQYTPDPDGVARVYSTVTLALAATVAGRGDCVELAPDFTTALTAAEILLAETNGVVVLQNGKNIFNRWFAERLTAATPQTTSHALFTVTGKIRLLNLTGVVTTFVQDQAQNLSVLVKDTSSLALGCTSIAAVTSVRNLQTTVFLTMTGTLSAAMLSSKLAGLFQAASVIINGSSQIMLKSSASSTGKLKWRVDYEPLEPGARVFPA